MVRKMYDLYAFFIFGAGYLVMNSRKENLGLIKLTAQKNCN